MKLNRIAIFLFLTISLGTNAQDWSTDKYQYGEMYEGYVVDKIGKKIEGFVKYQNRYMMQDIVYFYKEKDNQNTKKKYQVTDIREYGVGDKVYHCINYSGGASVSVIKANLFIADGCIKTYVWYERAPGYNTLKKRPGEGDEEFGERMFPATTIYYKDGHEMAVTYEFFEDNFEKKMSQYVEDNKELAKKIKSKEKGYTILNMLEIFKEYEEWCQSN